MGYAGSILRTVGRAAGAGRRPAAAAAHRRAAHLVQPASCAARCSSCPACIAYIAMITAVVSTALSIVREKERGTMEQVRMAPIDTFSVRRRQDDSVFRDLAASPPRCIILASMVLFGLPMRGSWLSLLVALSLFLVGALGIGLLISTVADTQQVAFQLALLSRSCRRSCCRVHLSDLQHADGAAARSPTSCRRATSSSRCAASC